MTVCTTAVTRIPSTILLLGFLFFADHLAAQNVGIGIATPKARLHVADSSVVFSAIGNIPGTPGNVPITGNGRRMMWYADKAAFRAGFVPDSEWNKSNIGNYSNAMGYAAMASAPGSTAFGYQVSAGGLYGIAIGAFNFASGDYTVAVGYDDAANGYGSTAIGHENFANGSYSAAFGVATTADGFSSTATGYWSHAKAPYSTVIGVYNDDTDNPDPMVAASSDRLFQVGNGVQTARHNALTLLHNGNLGIGTTNPSQKLQIASGGVRVDGPVIALGDTAALSIGGYGDLQVDAFGVVGGRFVVKENGNVGIGNNSPGFLLNFPLSLGDKVSFWGNSGAHYGIGIQSSLLQIHTDVAAADIAFGYGTSASFTENFRVKGNGALSVHGNTGASGQVLRSNGNTQSPSWTNPLNELYSNMSNVSQTGGYIDVGTSGYVNIPGLANIPFTVTSASKLIVSLKGELTSIPCTLCNFSSGFIQTYIYPVGSSTSVDLFGAAGCPPNGGEITVSSGMHVTPTLAAGNYYFQTVFSYTGGPTVRVSLTELNYVIVRQ